MQPPCPFRELQFAHIDGVSNVLLTRFLSPEGVGEVVDFMPVQDPSRGKKTHRIVRVVRAVRGAVRFRLECQPAFDYARRPHQVTLEGRGAVFEAPSMRFSLVSRFPLAAAEEFLGLEREGVRDGLPG